MSDEMSIEKVIDLIHNLCGEIESYHMNIRIEQAVAYLESLQTQPTGRTVEEIREYCRTATTERTEHDKPYFMAGYYSAMEDALNFIDSDPVEPVKVDDVCEWVKNEHGMFEMSCVGWFASSTNDSTICSECGRKILRKGE